MQTLDQSLSQNIERSLLQQVWSCICQWIHLVCASAWTPIYSQLLFCHWAVWLVQRCHCQVEHWTLCWRMCSSIHIMVYWFITSFPHFQFLLLLCVVTQDLPGPRDLQSLLSRDLFLCWLCKSRLPTFLIRKVVHSAAGPRDLEGRVMWPALLSIICTSRAWPPSQLGRLFTARLVPGTIRVKGTWYAHFPLLVISYTFILILLTYWYTETSGLRSLSFCTSNHLPPVVL